MIFFADNVSTQIPSHTMCPHKMKTMIETPQPEPRQEEYISVPLDPDVKSALIIRADANKRAVGREAAVIITKSVMRTARTSAQ